ncbi:TPA: hypothetical protein HA244_04810 [Candidatus Micrarchaeota archaeon]|nr:hypothetical protein [Candidatus Micrarchaeota archaeon]
MSDDLLFLLSLFFSALGIIALLYYSTALEPRELKPSMLSAEDVGKKILVSGTVGSFQKGKSANTFTICDSTCVSAVDFSQKQALERGSFISAVGTVKEYRGELEVEVQSLEIISEPSSSTN